MPYLMWLSRYSLLTQFILVQFILMQTVSEQLPRHRRLAGASRLSLGALSSLARSAISWSQMGILLALIPAIVYWCSVHVSWVSSPLSVLSESSFSDRAVGEGWGFGRAFQKD